MNKYIIVCDKGDIGKVFFKGIGLFGELNFTTRKADACFFTAKSKALRYSKFIKGNTEIVKEEA